MGLEDVLNYKWKGKYLIERCNHCQKIVIVCKKCNNSSCNGSSCLECDLDFKEFLKMKNNVSDYLSLSEKEVYRKGLRTVN